MSLATGARLGPYEIQSAIGAGGMGEVYKARDTRSACGRCRARMREAAASGGGAPRALEDARTIEAAL